MTFRHLGAFESTQIYGSNTDVLATTQHDRLWRTDLDLLLEAGIRDLRYPAPWHRIEKKFKEFDFSWMRGVMDYMERTGLNPIIDPLHHTSFPEWLHDGFFNSSFPHLYANFVQEFAQRYPWVRSYTVFNEPLPTTVFCSYLGIWHPCRRGDESFVACTINVAKAIYMATSRLRQLRDDCEFVHVDTAEDHRALDKGSEHWVWFLNQRRFLFTDLVLGKVNRFHPLYDYLISNGAAADDLLWLQDHPAAIHILGLDYYHHSESEWRWNPANKEHWRGKILSKARGFSEIALEYRKHCELPLMLSETNIRGYISDRLTWLKFMQQQCEQLSALADFRGFCWFPSIDSTDWSNYCCTLTGEIDPQGIWWLDDKLDRQHSELSDWYGRLARGEAASHDLPAHSFQPPLDETLAPFARLMPNFRWKEPTMPKANIS